MATEGGAGLVDIVNQSGHVRTPSEDDYAGGQWPSRSVKPSPTLTADPE